MKHAPGAAILAINLLLRSLMLAASIAASLSWHSTCSAADLYKWVDDKGQVHYSDAVPADAVNKKRDVLDSKGVVVDEVGAAKTKAELEEEQRRKEQEAIRQQQLKTQRKHDRMLLQTYNSASDIIDMRNRRIAAISDNITLNKNRIDKLNEDLTPLRKQIAGLQQNGREVPDELRRKVRNIEDHIAMRNRIIKQQHEEQARLRVRFQRDLDRFKALIGRTGPANRQVSSGSGSPHPHP